MTALLGRQGNLVVNRDCRGVKGPDGILLRDQVTDVGRLSYWFWCPGCDCAHQFQVGPQHEGENLPTWTFNGDHAKPTFHPSLLINGRAEPSPAFPRCHLFLVAGQLQFLGDCTHALRGRTVPIPEPPEWLA